MMNYPLFLIITPGFEDLALKEIELKCPVYPISSHKGGLSLEADLEWIMRAHTMLKIPTRILMRLTSFKVRDFPRLYQKLVQFRWTPFLSHPEPKWVISCSKSRLNHSGRIEDTANAALKEAMIRQPLGKDWEKKKFSPQTFYIRIENDKLTLSLDLTGEPLYKRGLQMIKGEAPIRENYAAAFAFEIFLNSKDSVTLIDPMCGSGTLLTEALSFHLPLHLRKFSFEEAPFFKGKILKLPSPLKPFPITEAIGLDINQDLINKIKQNSQQSLPYKLKCMDSLAKKITDRESVFLCNPPYGERINIKGKRGSFLKSAWEKFITVDRPYRLGWVLPSDMDDLFSSPESYQLITKRTFKNGGIPVTFWIWERKN